MVVRIGVAGLDGLRRDDVDGHAVLGVHEDQAAVLRGLLHGAEDGAVIGVEDAGVGGEELEVGDALVDRGSSISARVASVTSDMIMWKP